MRKTITSDLYKKILTRLTKDIKKFHEFSQSQKGIIPRLSMDGRYQA